MQVFSRAQLLSAVVLGFTAFAATAQESGRTVTPSELQWKPGRVAWVEQANIIGDSTKPGPYVQRVRFPANFTIQAHTHPDDRTYTVLSGTWYVGFGPKLDESRLKALPAGSFFTEPANVPHFVLTKGEPVVVHITGTGPTGVRLIDAAPAPKKE